ncbi:MAG: Gfo/Idh/MocA family oxidoreductase [Nitrospirae bacterium]|nr:Gfo/Idh/MocA family oxidoreductase [Nitrospirota bacterium]
MPVRVGVIGVGYLGQHHARIYSDIEGVELAAIADIDENKAYSLAEKFGCKTYSDYRKILPMVDAISIVTPTTSHYNIALECLKAGKDILVEKPLTDNIRDADKLVAESEKNGCILQVGHIERYNPTFIKGSEIINEPEFIEAERISPFYGRGTDVDVTLDLMIHDADIVLSIINRQTIKEIRATGIKIVTDKIDVAKAWIEFDNGCVAVLKASRFSQDKKRMLRVYQKGTFITIDFQNNEIHHYRKTYEGLYSDIIKPDNKEPLREELIDFIHCVKERMRPKVSAVEARNALKIVLDITDIIKKREG